MNSCRDNYSRKYGNQIFIFKLLYFFSTDHVLMDNGKSKITMKTWNVLDHVPWPMLMHIGVRLRSSHLTKNLTVPIH